MIHLLGADREPVLGAVVEVQRGRDEAKRRSWPLYTAALHAALRCPTCLVVIATDDTVARWAAAPIMTLQPGVAFAPLVLGPDRIPRVTIERARQEPWLAIFSALVHGRSPSGEPAVRAAAEGMKLLSVDQASVCYDLVCASLDDVARRILEEEMQSGKYEYRSEFARRYFGAGREEGQQEGRLGEARALLLALVGRRLGEVPVGVRARIDACADIEELERLVVEVGAAPDLTAVGQLFARE